MRTTSVVICWHALQLTSAVYAQTLTNIPTQEGRYDSIQSPQTDTIPPTRTATPKDSAPDSIPPASTQAPVLDVMYEAAGTIHFDMKKQVLTMSKKAALTYGNINIEAAEIQIDAPLQKIVARTIQDSTGKSSEKPVFTQGKQTYYTEYIRYHMDSKQAIIQGVVTQQDDAHLRGEKIRLAPGRELYVGTASYTSCDKDHPHFQIRAREAKINPGKDIVTGPFLMYIGDTPLPIGFLFGVFPQPKKRHSGVILPRYGDERVRGFYLQDGGYYFAMSDYMDLKLMGSVYTKGSYNGQVNWRYLKRYGFRGNMDIRYSHVALSTTEDNPFGGTDYWINWTHSPISKRSSRFSASVNLGSSGYNSNNLQRVGGNIKTEFSSNVSYGKTFTGTPFILNMSVRHRQNIQRKEVHLSLPELSWNTRRLYPLQRIVKRPRSPLRKLGISHTMLLRNELTNNILPGADPLPIDAKNLSLISQNAKNGIRHQIPIAMPFNVLRYLVFTPSLNYSELWYGRELVHSYDEATNMIHKDTVSRFSRAGHFSLVSGVSTRLYGTLRFKNSRVKAIRHLVTPSVSIGYQPDFSKEKYGVYKTIQTASGEQLVSKFDGFLFGTTPQKEKANISFQLNNQLELKVFQKGEKSDTFKKVSILDNLSLSSAYDILADSFALSPINMAVRTAIFNKTVSISASAILSPYAFVPTARETAAGDAIWQRTTKYAWDNNQGIGTITSVNASVNLVLQPRIKTEKPVAEPTTEKSVRLDQHMYVAFNLPWSLNIGYNINQRRQGRGAAESIQSITFNGNVRITSKTNISFSSGYDFQNKDFTQTSISFVRDLHCWEIVGSWVPFGRFTSYDITIRPKSAILKNVKFNRRRTFLDSHTPDEAPTQ